MEIEEEFFKELGDLTEYQMLKTEKQNDLDTSKEIVNK